MHPIRSQFGVKPPLIKPHFQIEMVVRDYEIDRFGMVNNAIYQNYFEHALHGFLASQGISLTQMLEKDLRPVVTRMNLDYLSPLQSDDHFSTLLWLISYSRVKFHFFQQILKTTSKKPSTQAEVFCTVIGPRGKPLLPVEFEIIRPLAIN